MTMKFNLNGLKFNLEGTKNSVFQDKEAEGKIVAEIENLSIEVEASIEEMVKEVIPHLKGAIEASIINQKK